MRFALALLVVGCGDATLTSDAGPYQPMRLDGARDDVGAVEDDAGVELDAAFDAGSVEADAGVELDAAFDAGSDAGVLEDAGPCPAGLWRCLDRCVDLNTDEEHCHACGNPCPPGTFCTPFAAVCVM